MKLAPLARFATALCAIWLTLVSAEIPGLHACAIHSPVTTGSSSAHSSPAGHSHGGPADSHSHKGQCSCPSMGCCSAIPFVPSEPASTPCEPVAHIVRTIDPPGSEALPRPPQFSIPFANGPPVVSAPQHMTV